MKKLKKITSIALIFILAIGVYGCGTESPSNTMKNYFENIKTGKNSDFSKLLDETKENEERKEGDISEENSQKLVEAMKKISYTINSEKIDGDAATVNVKVNGPDIAAVMLDYIQQAFANGLTQAFSTNKLTEEQSKNMDDDILSKCIDNIKYTDRTEDVSLIKKDGQWEVVNNDQLMTLLINIKSSSLNSNIATDEKLKAEVKEIILNEPFNVQTDNGNYILTIEGARATEKRNEFSDIEAKMVVILDYTYSNISFGESLGKDLYIDEYAFQVLDDEGNVLGYYPVYDDNRTPKEVPVGGKCKASATFGVPTESTNLNVTFTRGSEKVAKIVVPIK
ncbi:DUF4878 domain-containing protein [Clostridium algidicarnis]|uniref:DUF4878 domain-containing protein n=1 Tax=Clostridium algidicarnis TaxID=37659 RepID=UPI001C0C8210|nr:DUF4878 domain-containing protein [Clostridium algidicarnis]MBU3197498.1 DUF4878 domain-containing protein [Clostridium algidicarnis]